MATTTAHSASRDNTTITFLEAVVAVALALGIIFLFLGDAGETVTVISMATDATVVATGLAAQP